MTIQNRTPPRLFLWCFGDADEQVVSSIGSLDYGSPVTAERAREKVAHDPHLQACGERTYIREDLVREREATAVERHAAEKLDKLRSEVEAMPPDAVWKRVVVRREGDAFVTRPHEPGTEPGEGEDVYVLLNAALAASNNMRLANHFGGKMLEAVRAKISLEREVSEMKRDRAALAMALVKLAAEANASCLMGNPSCSGGCDACNPVKLALSRVAWETPT